ncbi:MAG: thiamine pyrophosphate-binding protein, partial [Burkholderiales bacterium]
MRELVARYLSRSISRRRFLKGLAGAGLSATAAQSVLDSLVPAVQAQDAARVAPEAIKVVEGSGALCFAEQLIATGVKYVFGNSASEDAQFYEALVDRPQLKYILTPHEGPGAAMAAGYVKASGEPTIVMQAAVVGLVNAMGQMFNAFKEQTPLVFYSYRTDQTGRAGRDGFEEVANQEGIVAPLTKYSWLARRADMIPETVRRAFKAAWTPPYGPTYASWHSDLNDERVRTEVILREKFDPRMRVRPNPTEVERAAKLLVEARMPLMIVGDEVYGAKAVAKAVKLAELLGMPVTQARQIYASFPEAHPLWVGALPVGRVSSLDFPKDPDVIINVGNKLQHNSPTPMIGRGPKFIDMRIDSLSMGNVMSTEVPLVADVGYGLDDLTSAVEQLLTPSVKQRSASRTAEVRKFSEKAKSLRALVTKNPDWERAPMIADRVTWEVAQFADPDAIIVHEAGSVVLHGFDFNPQNGRELFFYYGAHLGSGVGTAAGVKLARPKRQVICLVG